MTKSFSPSQAIQTGWKITTKNFGLVLTLMLIAYGIPQIIIMLAGTDYSSSRGIVEVINLIYNIVVSMGMLAVTLKLVRGQSTTWQDLFGQYKKFIPYILATILYSLMIGLGFIFFIIPGIYLALKYQFYTYCIIDKNMGPIEALKASGKITKNQEWRLLGLAFLQMGVVLLGLLAFLVGSLLALPVVMLASAYVFEQLSKTATKVAPAKQIAQKAQK